MNCLVCERIEWILNSKNPYFVMELQTGYVVLGDYQRFKGYTLFLCKKHVRELHELERDYKVRFLEEMSIVAEACQEAFHADKMNCELLGNGDAHLHFHLFPRVNGDTLIKGPVWWIGKEEMYDSKYKATEEEIILLKEKLFSSLTKVTHSYEERVK